MVPKVQFVPEWTFQNQERMRWASNVDLDAAARRFQERDASHPDAESHRALGVLAQVHKDLDVECSWGGYGEDRSIVLKKVEYLRKARTWTHLGVDFYVSAGTPVVIRRPVKILRIHDDTPEEAGWGTRIFMHIPGTELVLIFAHLGPKVFVEEGQMLEGSALKEGILLGYVGTSKENGGWEREHLHAQMMPLSRFYASGPDLVGFDGYGHPEDLTVFPNPLPYLAPSWNGD